MKERSSPTSRAPLQRASLLARLARPAGGAPLRVHCAGVGGTGMSGLARLALDLGHEVSGSDRAPSERSESLAGRGVAVRYEQDGPLPEGLDLLVATAALPSDHPELLAAGALGVPAVKYAEALAAFVAARRGVAIAGTHGKTTTTGLLATLLEVLGRPASYIVGGSPRELGVNAAIAGPEFVFEACEFDRSFLHYRPALAAILNVEADHLDCYPGGLDELVAAFADFACGIRRGGALVVNADCPGARRVADLVRNRRPDLSIDSVSLDGAGRVCAADLELRGGCPEFELQVAGRAVGRTRLALPGRHNALNALVALALLERLGVDPRRAATHLSEYTGVRRRFDLLAEGDVTVVSDYAHHPTALRAVVAAVRARFPRRRVVACFEPHQASRTRALFADFVDALASADRVLVSDIYLCRDRDEDARAVSAADLAAAVAARNPATEARHSGNLAALEADALALAGPGDVVLFLGAGRIGETALRVAEHVVTHPDHPAGNAAVLAPEPTQGPPQLLSRDRLERILERDLGNRIRRDVSLARHCTLRAGGRARFFAAPASEAEAIFVARTLQRRGVPFVPLGGGSNTLFTSERFDGAVLLTRRLRAARRIGSGLRAEAGASLPALIHLAERAGLGGLERFAGIPGTIGGAVFGNAGGPPGTPAVGDRVRRVRVLEPEGAVVWRGREELGLRYRGSDLADCLVLSVDLELVPDEPARLRAVRREVLLRKASAQPLGAWSAGCTFRNPSGESAGRIIDLLGLKGARVGDAEVSVHHGNFIVNRGTARPADILELMDLVRARVFAARGITLEPELRLVA